MARRSYRGDWGYFPKTAPRPVKGGIAARSQRGAIGETWWSKRWVEVLESFDIGARLQRGRSYARRGQVMSIDVAPGQVTAQVQGSMPRPYSIEIQLAELSDAEWARAIGAMASRAVFAAKLLAGEMPRDIESAFQDAQTSLFPARGSDLQTACSCPDWSNPCKHIAAVYYILAERFDEDPFLIFKLRGRSKEQIIAALRALRAAPAVADSRPEAPGLRRGEAPAEALPFTEAFWMSGPGLDAFRARLGQAGAPSPVLRQLGRTPFQARGRDMEALLSDACARAAGAALRKAGALPDETATAQDP